MQNVQVYFGAVSNRLANISFCSNDQSINFRLFKNRNDIAALMFTNLNVFKCAMCLLFILLLLCSYQQLCKCYELLILVWHPCFLNCGLLLSPPISCSPFSCQNHALRDLYRSSCMQWLSLVLYICIMYCIGCLSPSGYTIVFLRLSPDMSFTAPPLIFMTSAAQCRFWQRVGCCALLWGVSFWSLGPI